MPQEAQLSDVLTAIRTMQDRVEGLIAGVEDRMASLENRMTAVESRVAGIEGQLTTNVSTMAIMQNCLARIEDALFSVMKTQAEHGRRLEVLFEAVARLGETLAGRPTETAASR